MSAGVRAFSLFGADHEELEAAARGAIADSELVHVESRRGTLRVAMAAPAGGADLDAIRAACEARLGGGRWSLEESPAAALIADARHAGAMLVTAESCTGGLVAAAVTEISGSSDVFWGGFVTYANEAKEHVLSVPRSLLEAYGAVSEPVVRRMCVGALDASGATVAVSISGVAGPSGGTPEKPVGTVWIGVAHRDGRSVAERHHFPGDRGVVRSAAVVESIVLARRIFGDSLDVRR